MAVCESSQLESGLARMKREGSNDGEQSNSLPAGLPLTVDYRSPVSHFVPPAVELYAARHKQEISSAESSETTPVKRKRGRPRIDKSSPEYIASLAARKQAKEMAAVMNNHTEPSTGEKRKRGRPRIDKTSPEYLARKRARELEALERKAKRDYKRRSTADSGASSSTGDGTPRTKRKYTKRTPSAKRNDGTPTTEKVKGKRGRPRKTDPNSTNKPPQQGKIRVRNNLMPMNTEPISLDSDDEPDLGSPSAASDSLSLDENLRALRHIHEKYANIDKDDMFEAHLLAANFKKPPMDGVQRTHDDDVLSIRSSEGGASVKELDPRVEKLEDSSNSDSDSSSSGSGSSSGSSSSSSCSSSDSSDSSDSDSEPETNNHTDILNTNSNSLPPFSQPPDSESDSDPERQAEPPHVTSHDEISDSDNESPDKSFQCHICKKWYSTRVTLKIHRRSHQSRGTSGTSRPRARSADRYSCDICNMTFPRREKLFMHKAEAHRGVMTFRCEVCRRCFECDDELQLHRANHTQDERDGRCSECGGTFGSHDALARHVAEHGTSLVGAPLHDHGERNTHTHACAHCGKRFTHAHFLQRHMQNHAKQLYRCVVCKVCNTHAHFLQRHMQNHAKQLYRCVVCKASFARADQLAQHLNSHLANYKRLKP